MFRPSTSRLRTWWADATADILGGDLPPSEPEDAVGTALEYFRTHPHRQPLGNARFRRAGAVPPRPDFCISPVSPVRELPPGHRETVGSR
jgi:hypothetical protein